MKEYKHPDSPNHEDKHVTISYNVHGQGQTSTENSFNAGDKHFKINFSQTS